MISLVSLSVGNVSPNSRKSELLCIWGEVLLTKGLEANCCPRGGAPHRCPGSFILFSWPFLQGHRVVALAQGFITMVKRRRQVICQYHPYCFLCSWKLYLLRHLLACRLLLMFHWSELYPLEVLSYIKTLRKRMFSFSSLYIGSEREGCWDTSEWIIQQL